MSASGESSTTMHRLLHASGSHPFPPPDDPNSSSSSDSPMHFTDYTEASAQLRATIDKISLEQVQTRFHIDELKAALSKKISDLETAFLTGSDNQDRVVLLQNNVIHKEMKVQRAALP
ncbi:hypothetical protein F511_25110 [Dorcoceras hygrometricum]|uniref:Uncharacterized protein n=1 Tax=Dorcoceras hygrometricum TaxID=472368 RepID=A0A2Z7ANW6_9LAMI|nr:hypothetical protein F511_25110 [Dorcoceras hygrometricum]